MATIRFAQIIVQPAPTAPKPSTSSLCFLLFSCSEEARPVADGVRNEEFEKITRIHGVRRNRQPVHQVGGHLNFVDLAIGTGEDVVLDCVAGWLNGEIVQSITFKINSGRVGSHGYHSQIGHKE